MIQTHSGRGRNTWGQLGTGDDQDVLDEAGESVVAVDLDGSSASAIAAGEGHVCALLDDSSVKVSKRDSSVAYLMLTVRHRRVTTSRTRIIMRVARCNVCSAYRYWAFDMRFVHVIQCDGCFEMRRPNILALPDRSGFTFSHSLHDLMFTCPFPCCGSSDTVVPGCEQESGALDHPRASTKAEHRKKPPSPIEQTREFLGNRFH